MNDSFQTQMDRAVGLVEQQRLTEARDLYEHLCNACPDDAQIWFRFGAVNGMLGDLDAVVRCSRRAIELDPLMSGAWKNLGIVLDSRICPMTRYGVTGRWRRKWRKQKCGPCRFMH